MKIDADSSISDMLPPLSLACYAVLAAIILRRLEVDFDVGHVVDLLPIRLVFEDARNDARHMMKCEAERYAFGGAFQDMPRVIYRGF